MCLAVTSSSSSTSLPDRFFIDKNPSEQFVVSEVDRLRISQRAQRFSQGVEGNRKFKQKLSLNDLIKSAVGDFW